jgi:hypothetical protein
MNVSVVWDTSVKLAFDIGCLLGGGVVLNKFSIVINCIEQFAFKIVLYKTASLILTEVSRTTPTVTDICTPSIRVPVFQTGELQTVCTVRVLGAYDTLDARKPLVA